MGFSIGFIAFLMKLVEEHLIEYVLDVMIYVTQNEENYHAHNFVNDGTIPWLIYGSAAAFFALCGGTLTTYYGPAAAGSGIAELIGYLNGINMPDFLSIPTLITKIIGVTCAVCAKLCVGKEGPLAHIGANVGALVLYLPRMEIFRNDDKKRVFIAAGASAGVAVAFGAPIGGALFCYELSKPNTFWKFMMIWKVFLSCSIATFTMACFQYATSSNTQFKGDWSGSSVKFGSFGGI